LDAADVLLKLADRLADDTDSIGATATEAAPISRAAVEEALDVVRVRASVELSGFPPEVADVFLAAKVSPAAVDRMLVAALQRVQ
jgi:hypothetical protein